MSTNGIKVYLDFKIYEHLISKGIPAEVLKVKDLHYFLSVAHAEELFNMAKNDVNNQYEENIKRKKQIMLELSDRGVLNPSINKGVELRPEALDDALERVRATPHNYPMIIRIKSTFGKCIFQPQNICRGALNQAARQGLSARIRFARANIIFNFAVCFRRPR